MQQWTGQWPPTTRLGSSTKGFMVFLCWIKSDWKTWQEHVHHYVGSLEDLGGTSSPICTDCSDTQELKAFIGKFRHLVFEPQSLKHLGIWGSSCFKYIYFIIYICFKRQWPSRANDNLNICTFNSKVSTCIPVHSRKPTISKFTQTSSRKNHQVHFFLFEVWLWAGLQTTLSAFGQPERHTEHGCGSCPCFGGAEILWSTVGTALAREWDCGGSQSGMVQC